MWSFFLLFLFFLRESLSKNETRILFFSLICVSLCLNHFDDSALLHYRVYGALSIVSLRLRKAILRKLTLLLSLRKSLEYPVSGYLDGANKGITNIDIQR